MFKAFIQKAFKYKGLESVIVLSSYEAEYYSRLLSVPKKLFSFCHMGLNLDITKITISKGDYFVSAGRSNRDYKFLISCFEKLPFLKLIIVCDTLSVKKLPENISILTKCFGNDYHQLISNSFSVIISLDDNPISSGQLVALEAINLHKPIIVTKNPGIEDYVKNGINGLVINKDFDSLNKAINRLENPEEYKLLSSSHIIFTEENYGEEVGKIYKKIKYNE